MRLKEVAFGIALTMVVAGSAHAGQTWMGFSAGAGIPTGDYGNAASAGWHFGGTATRQVNDTWGIGADLGYHAWGGSDDANYAAEVLYGAGSEISWSAIQATGHAIARFPVQSTAKPYAKLGAGIYNAKSKLSSPSGDDDASKSKLGFNLGGGFDFSSSGKTRWGVDAAYHIISAKDDFGADLNFFTLGVNVVWGIGQ